MELENIVAILITGIIGCYFGIYRDKKKFLTEKRIEIYSEFLTESMAMFSNDKLLAEIKGLDNDERSKLEIRWKDICNKTKLFSRARLVANKKLDTELRVLYSLFSEVDDIDNEKEKEDKYKEILESNMKIEQMMKEDISGKKAVKFSDIKTHIYKNN